MGHQPRKRFGQNFLVDQQVIRRIVAAIRPGGADRMVEIGPGLGALTVPLLDTVQHLHVIEIDRDLIARIRQRFPAARVTVHEGDVLAFDFAALPAPLRVVGNLPYNISTPLLFHLAAFGERLQDATFMLQKEVVDRMVAVPGSTDFGRLSVMLQYHFEMASLFDVPPESFDPAPRVTSSIVWMKPRPLAERQAVDEALLSALVTAAFGQRRKTLRNTLKGWLQSEDWSALSLDAGLRAECLSVADYVAMANHLVATGRQRLPAP